MNRIFINYFLEFNQLSRKCKQLLVAYFLRSISAGITFFIGIYLTHIKMKWSVIGYEVTALTAGNLLGAWIATSFTDKKDPFKLSGTSLVIQGLCFILIAYSQQPLILATAVFVYGAAGYAYIAINHFLINSFSGNSNHHRAQAIAYSSIASNLGILVGGILVSYAAVAYAQIMFSFMAVLLFITSLFYFVDDGKLGHITNLNKQDNTQPNKRIYFLALIATFLLGFIFAQQRVGYQVFLDLNFTSSQVSMILTLNTLIILVLLPYLTRLMANHQPQNCLALGGFLLGLGMYLAVLSNSFGFILFLCIVRTLGEMSATTMSQLICFQFSPKTARGKAMGSHKLIFALGVTSGSFIGGKILTKLGLNAIWDLCGLLGIAIFVLAIMTGFKSKELISSIS